MIFTLSLVLLADGREALDDVASDLVATGPCDAPARASASVSTVDISAYVDSISLSVSKDCSRIRLYVVLPLGGRLIRSFHNFR